MAEEKTKTHRPEIKASCDLWDRFGKWMRVRGCQTLSEAFRDAMKIVTKFDGESQQKIAG